MYKIAILGCENSHSNRFLDLILKDKKYPDIKVVGVYSDNAEAAQRIGSEYGVYIAHSYDEFTGNIDGVIITARHGDNHYKYAKPYIKDSIPMFIDKPFTVSESDAVSFVKELKENKVRICGGSVCVYADTVCELKNIVETKSNGRVFGGFLRAPIMLDSPYGGFFFYSQHLAEVMLHIFGYYPNSVKAYQNNGVINCTVRYTDYDVNLEYVEENHKYIAAVSCENGFFGGQYVIDGGFEKEFNAFYELLCGEEQKKSYSQFAAPVFLLNATDRSIKSGTEEKIERIF